jgi:DNA-directed RNA polymerase subunit RPC12/RpoP
MSAAERVPCPVCGEKILAGARVCRFCGEKFELPESDTEGDATGGVIPYKNPPALIAYYCGVFSVVACVPFLFPLPIAALVLGIKGLKKAKAEPRVRGQVHAWIGIVCGSIFGLIGILTTVGAIIGIIAAINEGKFK